MLAIHGRPFDSDAHFFEFKWDGFRAAAMVERGSVRLMSRNKINLIERFPILNGLSVLPVGLALDGEIVAFRDGKPDFDLLLSSGKRTDNSTVKFIAFDLLYEKFEPRLALPFVKRRLLLEKILEASDCSVIELSTGIPSNGKALYQEACAQGLEGVMAKRLSSVYAPGRRNGSWVKIKRRVRIQVVIIGFIEKPGRDFQSLLVAGNDLTGKEPGPLQYLGRVGGGFTQTAREQMNNLLRERPRKTPLVACSERALWVEPGLYCEVSYVELTDAGLLRAPVFEGLIEAWSRPQR